MITVRYVNDVDKDFWYSLDQHLPEKEFDKKDGLAIRIVKVLR